MGTSPEPLAAAGPAAAPGGLHRRRTIAIAIIAGLVVLAVAAAAFLLNRPRTETAAPVQTSAPAPETTTPEPTPEPTPSPTPEPPPTALNILLVGSDSRTNARAVAASGAPSDQRGDALVYIHLPADRQSVYGISIMRDLWVNIPGYGGAKVNAALELGGVPLMTQTVEALLGQHIDHTVMLDFQGFAAMTDALGGVDVDIKQAFQGTVDDYVYFPAGVNRLNGLQALAFVRERHAFVDGDFQRVRNQQAFLKAVMAKLAAEGVLQDRNTVKQLISTVLPHVTVSPGLTMETLEHLAFSLRATAPGSAVFFTLPTAGAGTAYGQSVVFQDPAATAAVAAALSAGSLPEYIAANGLQNGN